MRSAIRDVRREGLKAAVIYAAVDAVAAFLAVNLLLVALEPPALPAAVPVPTSLTDPLAGAVGRSVSTVTLPTSALVALGAGLLVLGVDFWWRTRTPLVEQFEAVNPQVAEALRTARDAVEDDADSRMAARLYEDVLTGLRESSGVALVDVRRLAGTVVLVAVLSLATVQVAAVDLALLDGREDGPTTDGPPEPPRNYTGLRDGDSVLGESENVTAGDENLTAQIESTGGQSAVNRSQEFPNTVPAGDSGAVESQQAGYAPPEALEDAELIREYNLRIREATDEDDDEDEDP